MINFMKQQCKVSAVLAKRKVQLLSLLMKFVNLGVPRKQETC